MEFKTTLNFTVVTVEYDEQDARDMEGAVHSIEVIWNGLDIVEIMSQDDHDALIAEAEEDFMAYCKAEAEVV